MIQSRQLKAGDQNRSCGPLNHHRVQDAPSTRASPPQPGSKSSSCCSSHQTPRNLHAPIKTNFRSRRTFRIDTPGNLVFWDQKNPLPIHAVR